LDEDDDDLSPFTKKKKKELREKDAKETSDSKNHKYCLILKK